MWLLESYFSFSFRLLHALLHGAGIQHRPKCDYTILVSESAFLLYFPPGVLYEQKSCSLTIVTAKCEEHLDTWL